MAEIYSAETILLMDVQTLNRCRAHVALHLTKPDADITWLVDALCKLNDRAKEIQANEQ